MLGDGGLEAGGDEVEGGVPGDAFEAAFAFGTDAAEGVLQAVGMVLAFEVLGDFSAEESPRYGVVGIAFQLGGATVFDVYQHGAGIGTIERANRPPHFLHRSILANKVFARWAWAAGSRKVGYMLRMVSSFVLFTSVLSSLLSAEVDWRFAHPGADMLMGFNLKSLLGSPAGAQMREALAKMGGASKERLSLLEEVDEIYISVRTKYVKGRPSGEPLGVILVRGNFDKGGVMKMFEKQAKVAARFIDRQTILIGDEESMAGAAERLKGDEGLVGPVLIRAKELAAANDFWLVGSPGPLNAMKPRGSFKKQGGMLGEMEEVFDQLRSFSLGVALRDEISMDLGINLKTKAAADQLMGLYRRLEADMQKTPEGRTRWEQMAQSLEVHPNGTAVRFSMHGGMQSFQAAMGQAAQGLLAPIPVQVASVETKPVAAPVPVVTPRPSAPVRRTVRVYGMETGYREIPTTPR